MNENSGMNITFAPDVKKFIERSLTVRPMDRAQPTSKHSAGRTRPMSAKDKAARDRRLKRQRQQYMSLLEDQKRIGNG